MQKVQEETKLLEDDKVRKMLFPKIPIGGRLSHFLKEWEQITQDQWILSIIRKGYKLEFLQKPPFLGKKRNDSQCQKYKHYQFKK